MGKIILSIFLAASASSSFLLAQSEYDQVIGYRLQGTGLKAEERPLEDQIRQRTETTTNCQLPTANCDNSSLDLSCHLMMDPAELKNLEKGIEDLKGVFGSSDKTASPSKTAVATTATTCFPVGSSSSSAVVTGQRGVEATATALTEESEEAAGVNKFLEDEICNNIYMSCLAKVASLSLNKQLVVGGQFEEDAKEAAEWAAAERVATMDKEHRERDLKKYKREAGEAKSVSEAAQDNVVSSTNSSYEKAYADYTANNYEAKKLTEKLAEARVETASATLKAIAVRNTSQRSLAEEELAIAKEFESYAYNAAEAAKIGLTARALWCEASATVNNATDVNGKNQISAATRDDALQKALEAKAEWMKTADTCNNSLKKVSPEVEDVWITNLEEANNQQIVWEAKILCWEAEKIAASTAALNTNQKALEIAASYNQFVEACHRGQNQAPGRLKTWWINELKIAEDQRDSWNAIAIECKAHQETDIADATIATALDFLEHDRHTESLPLWDEAMQKASKAEEMWNQTSEVYQNGLDQAPLRLKDWWTEKLETAEDKKTRLTTYMLWCKAQKEGAIATAAMQQVINSQQDITAQELVTALWVTPAMAQIPLCESAKLKAIQAERSWGHVAEVKHKGCDQAPLRLKAAWTKELEIAENNRAMFATDALFCEAYRGGHMAYDLMKKALSASDDEEELLLWEETKLQIIKAEQLWSQAVEANRRDQAKAPDTLKTNWIATLETSEDGRERWGAYLLWCEALKVTGPAHDAEKIARNTLTDLSLWNKAKIKVGQVERAWTQAAWAGRRGRDQAPERLKASWIADLKAVENMEYRWSSKDSWYEAFKENITAFSAMTEAQNNFTAQNISLWNDVKLKAAQAKIAWAKAAEVKLKGRDQAPERLKAPWIEELEAAENYQTLNESFEFWCEANKLTCIADDASQKVNKTSVQSLDEVKSKAAQAEKAWSKAAEVKRKASNQTSGYFKDNFLKESKDAEFKEVLYAEKSFWCEANKVTIFADAAYNKAKAIPKAKAPLWNEVIIQGDQAERGWVQVIEANKKSLDKAPPQFKNFLEGLIKEAEENRTSWKNIITEATQKKADAEAYSSLFALSPFVSNTWYDEQIIAAEKAEAEASEKVPTASNQLEEAQKALKTLDDQIQEESSKGAKAKLANLKKQFQAHLQELQSMRETMEQTVKQCGNEIKARQRAVVWASEKVQKAKAAKEVALATIFTHFNQVNKDLVEGIETDQKEFDRNKRVLEATAKTDSERAEKERKNHPLTATLEAELAKKQDEEKIAAEKEKAREKEATGKEVLAGKNKGDEEIALQAQIEELKQFSLKNKVMKDASSNSSEQWELKQSIDRFDDAVEYLNNAIRAIVPGTSENAVFVLWKEAAARSKESAEQYIASAQVLIKGTKIEADRLDTLADLLFIQSRHAKYLAKATEAEANGKKELAEKWYEIEKINQQAVEPLTQGARARGEGKEKEGLAWQYAGQNFYFAAAKLGKAIEAEAAGKVEVAKKYREAAEQQVCSVEPYVQAARAYATGKTSEGANWDKAGMSCYYATEKLEKAIEAESCSNPTEAKKCSEVGEQQTAKIVIAEKSFKEKQEMDKKETDRIVAEIPKLQTEAREKSAEATRKSLEARSKAQTATGDSLSCWKEVVASLEKSSEYWEKASEAQAALVVDYSLAATESEQAAEQSRKAAEAYAKAGGRDTQWQEGNCWRKAGRSTQWSADCRIKGMEARSIGKDSRVQEYTAAVERLQKSTKLFIQTVQLLLEGKEKEHPILWSQGSFLQSEGMSKKYALQGLEAQEAGKVVLATDYREAAATSQRAADQWKLSAQTYAAGKEYEGIGWEWEGSSLQSKANYQSKASEAQEVGKTILAAGYRDAATTSQWAADQWKLSAQTFAAGKESEGISWHWAGSSLQSKANYQSKASEAQEAGQTNLAADYREAIAISQRAADQWKLSAEIHSIGKKSEGNSWGWEGSSLQARADYQAKASEAQEVGKTQLAAGYRDAATTFQRAADQHKLSAETKAVGRESEGISWDWEGRSLQAQADYQAKAIEAQEAGKTTLAAGYREASIISQKAADRRKLSAQTKAAGKKDEGMSWGNEGKSLQSKADYGAKAIEAQEAGKTSLAAAYREAAATSQSAADQQKLSAQTLAAGNSSEGKSLAWEGSSLQSKADYGVKAIEAQEAGKITLSAAYREAATTSQRAADQYKQSAQACAAGNSSEDTCLFNAAKATQVESDAKAIQAETDEKATKTAEEAKKKLEEEAEKKHIAEEVANKKIAEAHQKVKTTELALKQVKEKVSQNAIAVKIPEERAQQAGPEKAAALEAQHQVEEKIHQIETSQKISEDEIAKEHTAEDNAKKEAIQVQIEELKKLSLESKAMKNASSDSFEQQEWQQSNDRFHESLECLDNLLREEAGQHQKAAVKHRRAAEPRTINSLFTNVFTKNSQRESLKKAAESEQKKEALPKEAATAANVQGSKKSSWFSWPTMTPKTEKEVVEKVGKDHTGKSSSSSTKEDENLKGEHAEESEIREDGSFWTKIERIVLVAESHGVFHERTEDTNEDAYAASEEERKRLEGEKTSVKAILPNSNTR